MARVKGADSAKKLNIWFDMKYEVPLYDLNNSRRVFFLSSVDDAEDRQVVIVHTKADLLQQLEEDGAFGENAPYSHWLEWFPTEETFQVSIGNLQNVAGTATFPTPPRK